MEAAPDTARDPHLPGPGELAPGPDFRLEDEVDVDGDGRHTLTGKILITHPELGTDGFGEATSMEVARLDKSELELAMWMVRALNDRAAHDQAAGG
jgi:hypothetical protein